MTELDFQTFLKDYENTYYIPISVDTILRNLEKQNMFIKTSLGNYRFSYRYLYYYFVAKYLADHYKENKFVIEKIIENLHTDENAYIAIFVSHHTQNNDLLDGITLTAMCLFEKNKETSLSKDELAFFDTELDNIIQASLPKNSNAEQVRSERLKQLDSDEDVITDDDAATNKDDEFAKYLRKSIKTVEVMGIITKNRTGSLPKQRLEELLSEAIKVHLRILSSFFDIIKEKDLQESIIELISSALQDEEKNKSKLNDEESLKKQARKIFWNLNFGVIYGFIHKTITSIGSDNLKKIIEQIADNNASPVYKLIKHGVIMWYGKNLQLDKIIHEIKSADFSDTAIQMMKFLIVNHCAMHSIDAGEKNRIEHHFHISSKALLRIESKSKNKFSGTPLYIEER